MLDTNLKSVYNCTKSVLNSMIHKKAGKIIVATGIAKNINKLFIHISPILFLYSMQQLF